MPNFTLVRLSSVYARYARSHGYCTMENVVKLTTNLHFVFFFHDQFLADAGSQDEET